MPAPAPTHPLVQMIPIISIIDDDESVQAATRGLVRSLGFRAYTFGSAEDFLQSRCIEKTSCVITDVKMPGMSGVELQSLLIAQAPRMPIVFVTAFPNERIRAPDPAEDRGSSAASLEACRCIWRRQRLELRPPVTPTRSHSWTC